MPSPTPTATDDRTTETPDAPTSTAEPVETPSRRRVPTFGLSLTQLIAAGLATTTATVAASFLGVTGTVIGAALASVTTAVGNAVYGQSLRGGRDRLRAAVPVLGGTAAHAPAAAPETTRRPDVVPLLPAAPPVRPLVCKRVAIGAVSVFVAVLAVVTGVEVVAGRPIADVVRGDSGSGTSFFGGSTVVTRTSVVTPPVPTMTVTVTPKVVTSTPTVTATAPATTKTATSGTTTVTPTPSDTTSPSGSSTPTGTPSTSG